MSNNQNTILLEQLAEQHPDKNHEEIMVLFSNLPEE